MSELLSGISGTLQYRQENWYDGLPLAFCFRPHSGNGAVITNVSCCVRWWLTQQLFYEIDFVSRFSFRDITPYLEIIWIGSDCCDATN